MLTKTLLTGARTMVSRRSFGVCVPAAQKVSDPIQKLFLDKIREYKSKSVNGALVDPTPETERELKNELLRIAKQFGGGDGVDLTKFPTFNFTEPKLDAINASTEDTK